MKTRMGLVFSILVSALILWPAAATTTRAGGCSLAYTVQRGDTLRAIAARVSSSVAELAQLNQLKNPDLIYVGQVLCLPPSAGSILAPTSTPAPTETPTPESGPALVIEATYRVLTATSESDDQGWNLSPRAGIRVAYPLLPDDPATVGDDGILTYQSADALRLAVSNTAPVMFWIQARASGKEYVLVSVGDGEPLDVLRLDGQQPAQPFEPDPVKLADLIDRLGGPNTELESVSIWLEAAPEEEDPNSASGAPVRSLRYPLSVTRISHMPDVEEAKSQYSNPQLVLLSKGNGLYQLLAVLNKDTQMVAPPGVEKAKLCKSWPSRGWHYRLVRALYGCRRR